MQGSKPLTDSGNNCGMHYWRCNLPHRGSFMRGDFIFSDGGEKNKSAPATKVSRTENDC